MRITVKYRLLDTLLARSESGDLSDSTSQFFEELLYDYKNRSYKPDTYSFNVAYKEENLPHMEVLKGMAKEDSRANNGLLQQLSMFFRLGDFNNLHVNALKDFPQVVEEFLTQRDDPYLQMFDGHLNEWHKVLVISTHYSPADSRSGSPASARIAYAYLRLGRLEKTQSYLYNDAFINVKKTSKSNKQGSFLPMLESMGFMPITDGQHSTYRELEAKQAEYVPKVGTQIITHADYVRVVSDRWYTRDRRRASIGNDFNKYVIDMPENKKDGSGAYCQIDHFEGTMNPVPSMTSVYAFDLQNHDYVEVHVNRMQDYQYDTSLRSKLVIPERLETFLDLAVGTDDIQMSDVVSNKSGGRIVIALGPPGTGKTLTAEVYSEVVEKPLYVVQCAQLGTSPTNLEDKLMGVLKRASRLDCVLLIDEADVYISERTSAPNNLLQNAIVGVFLRLLEKYTGVLFLCSNKVGDIDDAIISRALAVIQYDYPNQVQREKIWRILLENYGLSNQLDKAPWLAESTKGASGRDIKTMCKMFALYIQGGKRDEITEKLLATVSDLHNFNFVTI